MSQFDFGNIDEPNTSGDDLGLILETWRDAIHSMHRGSSRPSYAVAGTVWSKIVSSTVEEVYIYDGGTDILIGTFNPTAHTWTPVMTAASESAAGAIEIATAAEAADKTIDNRALTPKKLIEVVHEFERQQGFKEATLTDAASIAWDCNTAQVAKVTIAGNRTFLAPTNQKAGFFYSLSVIQDANGGRTAAWNSVFKFPSGAAPTLSIAPNAIDIFTFRSDGTNMRNTGIMKDVR